MAWERRRGLTANQSERHAHLITVMNGTGERNSFRGLTLPQIQYDYNHLYYDTPR
jgi:hypothetical protein